MTRRQFNRMIASVAILCATGAQWVAARSDISRFMKALKSRTFPGRLRPLDDAEIRKAAKWLG